MQIRVRSLQSIFHILIISILAGAFSLVAGDKNKKNSETISWLEFEDAIAAAKKEKKVLVVDFYTDWCTWCKEMERETYGNSEVIKYANENVILSKVNAESNTKVKYKDYELTYRQLARAFNVSGYPATIFIDQNGDYLTSVPGYIKAEQFMPMLEFLAEGHYKNMQYNEYLAKRESES